jgi:hypothetical protein
MVVLKWKIKGLYTLHFLNVTGEKGGIAKGG